jgi:paraquat-inducible protein B
MDWSRSPVRIPTVPGKLQKVEEILGGVLEKLDKIPFEQIGADLNKALVDLDDTLVSARGTLDNANRLVEPNSVLGQELEATLQEVSGAARAVRLLADYLERHPEALIKGKTEERE